MTSTAITNIGQLVTNEPDNDGVQGELATITGAALIVEDDRIAWVGRTNAVPAADHELDADGHCVLPGFVDSHTHLVFAGDRSAEFAARMGGQPYDGGGIATTVAATRATSDDDLEAKVRHRVAEARRQGSTTLEIKSGYGLNIADELRSLRIAGRFTDEVTFLGAHVVPPEIDRNDYLELITGAMLRACAPYAKWIDVFCEPHSPHAFTEDESRRVLQAGIAAGLQPRVHGNQLGPGPGARLAVEVGAASVDHCSQLTDADIETLAGSDTVATLLPGVEFSTRTAYPDARRLIDAGVTVALATDCNPGTCYSNSMPLMIALAVRELRMTIEEAIRAATLGAARSLRRDDIGRVAVGTRADLAILDAPDYRHLAYRVGVPIARTL